MRPERRIRYRYALGLSAMAILLVTMFFLTRDTIHRQETFYHLVSLAKAQVSHIHRIAFFTEQLAGDLPDNEIAIARAQIRLAVGRMRAEHNHFLHGAAAPQGHEGHSHDEAEVGFLRELYYGDKRSTEVLIERFMDEAERVAAHGRYPVPENNAAYAYVVTIGPHVLQLEIAAAADRYEAYASSQVRHLELMENLTIGLALLLLIVEAALIFWPMEKIVRDHVRVLTERSEELAAQKEAAEAADRAKSDFLANMNHELRTPLNAILGFSEGLMHGIYGPLGSKKVEDSVRTIHETGRHLLGVVNDILEISAAEDATVTLHESAFRLSEGIETALTAMAPMADEAGVRLTAPTPDGPSACISADWRRVQQVLLNLISNAIKFTRSGGTVEVREVQKPDGSVGLQVSDTGVGMTPDQIEVAKERFGQVELVDARRHGGTGLGVPVVVELVRRHGGRLEIESQPGIGSTFTAWFPAERRIAQAVKRVV
jgi:signal transduction histidine kinase